MAPEETIAALDQALEDAGEDIVLYRQTGSGNNVVRSSVTCRAKVTAVSVAEIAAGITQTELNVVLSPTQIDQAQWPGGTLRGSPPYDVDPRIPILAKDHVIARKKDRAVTFVDPQFVDGVLVRINLRVSG